MALAACWLSKNLDPRPIFSAKKMFANRLKVACEIAFILVITVLCFLLYFGPRHASLHPMPNRLQ